MDIGHSYGQAHHNGRLLSFSGVITLTLSNTCFSRREQALYTGTKVSLTVLIGSQASALFVPLLCEHSLQLRTSVQSGISVLTQSNPLHLFTKHDS